MALATTYAFSKLKVRIGDGASTESFSTPCGLNARALQRTKTLNEIDIPDCDDEDAPAWIGREVKSLDWKVTGEGVLAAEALPLWEAMFEAGESRNVQIEILTVGVANDTISKIGRAHLSSYEISGNRGEKVGVTIELTGDGALVDA